MIVSLEAIFLSTFLLISQNRADERRQLLANSEWELVQQADKQNELEVKQNAELLECRARSSSSPARSARSSVVSASG